MKKNSVLKLLCLLVAVVASPAAVSQVAPPALASPVTHNVSFDFKPFNNVTSFAVRVFNENGEFMGKAGLYLDSPEELPSYLSLPQGNYVCFSYYCIYENQHKEKALAYCFEFTIDDSDIVIPIDYNECEVKIDVTFTLPDGSVYPVGDENPYKDPDPDIEQYMFYNGTKIDWSDTTRKAHTSEIFVNYLPRKATLMSVISWIRPTHGNEIYTSIGVVSGPIHESASFTTSPDNYITFTCDTDAYDGPEDEKSMCLFSYILGLTDTDPRKPFILDQQIFRYFWDTSNVAHVCLDQCNESAAPVLQWGVNGGYPVYRPDAIQRPWYAPLYEFTSGNLVKEGDRTWVLGWEPATDPATGLPSLFSVADLYNIDPQDTQIQNLKYPLYGRLRFFIQTDPATGLISEADIRGCFYGMLHERFIPNYYESYSGKVWGFSGRSITIDGQPGSVADLVGMPLENHIIEATVAPPGFVLSQTPLRYQSRLGIDTHNPDDFTPPQMTGYMLHSDGKVSNLIPSGAQGHLFISFDDCDNAGNPSGDFAVKTFVAPVWTEQWTEIFPDETSRLEGNVGTLFRYQLSDIGLATDTWYKVRTECRDAAGNFVVNTLEYVFNLTDTDGVQEIAGSDTGQVQYFNLQGIPVENPANGLFIRRQGSKSSKVAIP